MKNCAIYYIHPCDIRATRDEKFDWLKSHNFNDIPFEHIIPDKNNNWINLTENDWDEMIPIYMKENSKETLFKFSSLGVSTNRDEWVYDISKENLLDKIQFFINKYNELIENKIKGWDESIKWSRDLKKKFERGMRITLNELLIVRTNYRPFNIQNLYSEKILNDILTQNHYQMFGKDLTTKNYVITLSGSNSNKPFQVLCVNKLFSLDFLEKTQCLPLYRYDDNGNRIDNITDWGLGKFRERYGKLDNMDRTSPPANEIINKEDIFHYVYAVLHNPEYRKKYEINLKREFPRIPFYDDFWKWAEWGKELMDLHINFEEVEKYDLKIVEVGTNENPKSKLKANKDLGEIALDDNTLLKGIPKIAWDYKLGNRSALEWILDQYKDKKPKDPTIAEKFNTYRFADYKDKVIDLLGRVTTVSVKTMEIIKEMEAEVRESEVS